MSQLTALRALNAVINGTMVTEALNTFLATRQAEWNSLFNNTFDIARLYSVPAALTIVAQSPAGSKAITSSPRAQTLLFDGTPTNSSALATLLNYSAYLQNLFSNSNAVTTLLANTTAMTVVNASATAPSSALASNVVNRSFSPKLNHRTVTLPFTIQGQGRSLTVDPATDTVYANHSVSIVMSTDIGTVGTPNATWRGHSDALPTTGLNAFNTKTFVLSDASGGDASPALTDDGTYAYILGPRYNSQDAAGYGGLQVVKTLDFKSYSTTAFLTNTYTNGAAIFWKAIAYGNGVLVVYGRSGSNTVAVSSTDGGVTWSSVYLVGNVSNSNITDFKYLNGYFVGVHGNGVSYFSTTGLAGSWTSRLWGSTHTTTPVYGRVAYSGTHFCIFAYNSSLNACYLYRSADNGATWLAPVVVQNHGGNVSGNLAPRIASNGSGTLVLTFTYYDGVDYYGIISRSTNHGASWTNIYTSPINCYGNAGIVYHTPSTNFLVYFGYQNSSNGMNVTAAYINSAGSITHIDSQRGTSQGAFSHCFLFKGQEAYFFRDNSVNVKAKSVSGTTLLVSQPGTLAKTGQYTSAAFGPIRWCDGELATFVGSVGNASNRAYFCTSSDGWWWSLNYITSGQLVSNQTSVISDLCYVPPTAGVVGRYFLIYSYNNDSVYLAHSTDKITWTSTQLGATASYNSGTTLEVIPETSGRAARVMYTWYMDSNNQQCAIAIPTFSGYSQLVTNQISGTALRSVTQDNFGNLYLVSHGTTAHQQISRILEKSMTGAAAFGFVGLTTEGLGVSRLFPICDTSIAAVDVTFENSTRAVLLDSTTPSYASSVTPVVATHNNFGNLISVGPSRNSHIGKLSGNRFITAAGTSLLSNF